jgi:hypothetical protein
MPLGLIIGFAVWLLLGAAFPASQNLTIIAAKVPSLLNGI